MRHIAQLYHLHTSLSIRVYMCMMNSQEENFRPKCMTDFCPIALLRGCPSLQSHHENLMKVINSPQTKYIFYIYTCTHTYICIQQCIYDYTYVYMCLCVCIRIYIYTHIYAHTRILTYVLLMLQWDLQRLRTSSVDLNTHFPGTSP